MQSWMVTTLRDGDERREHVVRGVKQVEPLAPHRQRNRDLFADRIVARAFRNGAKVLPQRRRDMASSGRQ